MKKFYATVLLSSLLFAFSVAARAQNQIGPNPEALVSMSRGDFRGAVAVLDKDIAKNRNLFESYKLRAAVRRMTGDFAGALADFDRAIELKADDGALYEQRATLRMILRHDFALVLKDLDAAVSSGRKQEKIYSLRAMIRRDNGDEPGAISDYETAVGLRPDAAQPHVGLASIYMIKGDTEKAVAVLENFLNQIESSGAKIPKSKGEITASSVNLLPPNGDKNVQIVEGTTITRGEFNFSGPPTPEQLEKMTEKIEQSKNIALAYFNLAQLYEKQKNYEKALETVEKGLRLSANDFYGYETRGKIKLSAGDYAGAVADLGKSIKMMPNMGSKYLDRGIAYLMLGKNAEAQADFDRYLQIFPQGKTNLEKRIAEAKQKLAQ